MCGRFTLVDDPAEAAEEFKGVEFPTQFAPRYNVAPSQPILVIPNNGTGRAEFMIWGLIPSWAKDPSIGSRLINARAETLTEKPSFRGSYRYKRCLIPADGFYEWKGQPGSKAKIPYFIRLKSHKVFAFAGLWSDWRTMDGSSIRTCTIITTTPNELMVSIHNRMPLLLSPDKYTEWLDPEPRTPDRLNHLIKPFPADLMQAYAVSPLVNDPANDRAECILPA